jgi:hypothetical protein
MRKSLIVALAGLLVVALIPAVASAGKGKKKSKAPIQEVEGSIAAPAPYTDDSGCYAGMHRRGSIVTDAAANGVIGHEFDVDAKSWNKPFAMEITGGEGTVDLDIYFYGDFGTVDDVAGDPLNAGSPYTVSFNTRDNVGEEGIVPLETTKVIVCMMAGGADATYKYTAGPGAKLP